MKLNEDMPEIGIQLLRRYHSQGIGIRVVNLFVNKLKSIMRVKDFKVRICSDNYISQRMFEKLGAIKSGEEGKEYVELIASGSKISTIKTNIENAQNKISSFETDIDAAKADKEKKWY